MKLATTIAFLLGSSLAHGAGYQMTTNSSTFHTSIVNTSEMSCATSDLKPVRNKDGSTIIELCAKDYSDCMFFGACIVDQGDKRIGLTYQNYLENKGYSYFAKTNLDQCPYGTGIGKVSETRSGLACLIPYASVSADPIEYTLGDVIYLPALVGVKLPNGKVHDGYVIVVDHASGYIGTGPTQFSIFTGTENTKSKKNVLVTSVKFTPEHSFKFKKVTTSIADKIRKKHGFKVLKTYKQTFSAPENPMLDGSH